MPSLRIVPLLLLSCVLPAGFSSRAAAVPEPYPLDRYEQMRTQSPFALATAEPTPTEPERSFADNYVLTGLAKLKDVDGVERDFVTIKSRDETERITLFGPAEEKGFAIETVNWSPVQKKSTVRIKKGGQSGVVEFSQDPTPTSMPNQTAIARPIPGIANTPVGTPPRGGRVTIPRPAAPVQIPRPTNAPQSIQPTTNVPNAPQPTQGRRQRIRVINSQPNN